jgi:integrase
LDVRGGVLERPGRGNSLFSEGYKTMAGKFPGVYDEDGYCLIRWYEGKRRPSKLLTIPYSPAGIKKAFKVRQQMIHQFERGEAIGSPVPTFYEVAKIMLDSTQIKDSSRRVSLIHLNNFWLPRYQTTPIDEIKRPHIKRDFAAVIRDYSPKYARDILSSGSNVFQTAIEEEWIDSNPVLHVSAAIKLDRKVIDPFTFDERDQILAALSGQLELFYTLRFYNGLRPGEAIALRYADVRDGLIYITRKVYRGVESPPKNNKERVIPVHPEVARLLKIRNIHDDHVILNSNNEPYTNPNPLTDSYVRILKKINIRYRSPYNARHTCASMMLHAGMNPAKCAEYLGHTLEMFFRIYAKLIEDAQGRSEQENLFKNSGKVSRQSVDLGSGENT